MNFNRHKYSKQFEAAADQRRREDAAERLRDLVPTLTLLRLSFQDRREPGLSTALPYTRLVPVASAPALFAIRCIEPRCSGRHELTAEILHGLRAGQAHGEGESSCSGSIGDVPCDHTLVYAFDAEYRA